MGPWPITVLQSASPPVGWALAHHGSPVGQSARRMGLGPITVLQSALAHHGSPVGQYVVRALVRYRGGRRPEQSGPSKLRRANSRAVAQANPFRPRYTHASWPTSRMWRGRATGAPEPQRPAPGSAPRSALPAGSARPSDPPPPPKSSPFGPPDPSPPSAPALSGSSSVSPSRGASFRRRCYATSKGTLSLWRDNARKRR